MRSELGADVQAHVTGLEQCGEDRQGIIALKRALEMDRKALPRIAALGRTMLADNPAGTMLR